MLETHSHVKPYWILAFVALTACSGAAEIPDTPDLTGLQHEYDQPSATLDATTVQETLEEIPPLDPLAAGFRASTYATTGVDNASGTASKKSGGAISIQGSLRVDLRCPGDLDSPTYDPDTNGRISMTVGVADNRIKRSVGGTADHCVLRGRLLSLPIRVELEGPIEFDLGHDVGLRARWSGTLLMVVKGSITIGDPQDPILALDNLSARYTEERLEYLHERPDGTTVVAELSGDGIQIKDHEKVWFCRGDEPCVTQ
jgi:hypothetical protein